MRTNYKQNNNGTYSKPPCSDKGHTIKDGSKGVTFEEAIKDGYPGIKTTKETNLIAFDVDDKAAKLGKKAFRIDELSDKFKTFVTDSDSYMELSPSGCGVRVLMSCDD